MAVGSRRSARQFGLSARLITLTVAFVLVGEIIVYVPMLASYRRGWLSDRVSAAQTIALVLSAYPDGTTLPRVVERRLLDGIKAQLIAIRGSGTRWLLTQGEVPPGKFAATVDLRDVPWWGPLRGLLRSMFRPSSKPLRVIGDGMTGIPDVEYVEVLLDESTLRDAMLGFTRQFLGMSLIVCAVVAAAMVWALHRFLVRPVHRLTAAITAFAEAPEDSGRIIKPSGRTDEIGTAERALAGMQTNLAGELRHKRHLAEIGLGVSKVNHELRNMLTTAQLLSDRLEGIKDPTVERVAPRLVRTLNRAIEFCGATLSYGRTRERQPQPERILPRPFVEELRDLAGLVPGNGIDIDTSGTEGIDLEADPEHLHRILANLVRNAVQALASGRRDGRLIRISADRTGDAHIRVSDNGPGVPERIRGQLFGAFQTLARDGGAGLGLAVANELVQLHGGTLVLERTAEGASFLITLPQNA